MPAYDTIHLSEGTRKEGKKMENLLIGYNATTAATLYFIGFILHGLIYGGFVKVLPLEALQLSRESTARGGALKIRVRFKKDTKLTLKARGIVKPLTTITALEVDKRYNRGDNFEKWVVENIAGKQWAKNSTPYWISGDMELNGEQVQIKFDGAELVNEKSLRKAIKATA